MAARGRIIKAKHSRYFRESLTSAYYISARSCSFRFKMLTNVRLGSLDYNVDNDVNLLKLLYGGFCSGYVTPASYNNLPARWRRFSGITEINCMYHSWADGKLEFGFDQKAGK